MSGAIERVAVCGAGAMGSGIAQVAAQAGAFVMVYDAHAPALDAGRQRVADALSGLTRRGKLSVDDAEAIAGRICWTGVVEDLASAQLVLEAIIEDIGIKRALFTAIERVVDPAAIVASNTSSLSIADLARTLEHPPRFVGMHFFNPAQVMKLVEVVAGEQTAPDVLETVSATARSWGKVAVTVADVPGFIVNRVARPFYAEAFAALGEGAAVPEVIDHLFRACAGFRMGPLELTDLIGQDVNNAVAQSIHDAYAGNTRFTLQPAQGALVDAGHLGRKTGRGVYDHRTPAQAATPAKAVGMPMGSDTESHREAVAQLFERRNDRNGAWIEIGGSLIGWGRGRTAAAEGQALGRCVAVIDWIADTDDAPLCFAASSDSAANAVIALAHAAGRDAFRVADRAGILILRTLAQLANAACDAVRDSVADEAAIDAAMRFGANYPYGPFEWMDRYGRLELYSVLTNIAIETGAVQYTPSSYLPSR
ncbi:3-hydroxyacyl-CoA dehydrogenase NAD-binding domain-containing protein [Sphingomonas sp. PP-CC-3G-468]|uniref:3-hydroxyacyl-CoA dehydrogenase NAD-binding domain-containing protein n=1 Tax=Sphingomonas sp. PP-CC-3G-468 TaxID=2135656 RepID=UPI00104F1B5B|nr:3-hydroxyacyl-CoA dehydrogenase NAD-binding domain-containing protein [Sphingomonas sp. PP-CC-3G-468]TCM02925.1 3-hydroxyacyl-CoA dehydrogenase [Sphingomonas sp. PP-CC-3G-468]